MNYSELVLIPLTTFNYLKNHPDKNIQNIIKNNSKIKELNNFPNESLISPINDNHFIYDNIFPLSNNYQIETEKNAASTNLPEIKNEEKNIENIAENTPNTCFNNINYSNSLSPSKKLKYEHENSEHEKSNNNKTEELIKPNTQSPLFSSELILKNNSISNNNKLEKINKIKDFSLPLSSNTNSINPQSSSTSSSSSTLTNYSLQNNSFIPQNISWITEKNLSKLKKTLYLRK